jgi:hypothetical protein
VVNQHKVTESAHPGHGIGTGWVRCSNRALVSSSASVLVDAVRRMDVDALSIAEIWRQAGATAGHLGVSRPGYHSVLAVVLEERRRHADRREAIAEAVGEVWAFKGTDYGKLTRRLAQTRRPRRGRRPSSS